ncbi:MAG: lamin tail domain-containing protein, partial [Flavobacteriales bacterium]|nr:lamin tail domain-containing protein [Flavobacteriales bacterium]
GAADTPRVTISEINYNSNPNVSAGDWIELHNYGTVDIDLSGWTIKDSNDANSYTIPDSTVISAGGYLVVVSNILNFSTVYPGITNYIGAFNFGLSSSTEMIRLFDENGDLYLGMSFDGASPWPTLANGAGHTLELLDPYNNLSSSTNWFDGCYRGSPGVGFAPCIVGMEDTENDVETLSVENYPNPFNQYTNIFITVIERGLVKARLIDLLGNEVAIIHQGELEAGRHYFNYQPDNLSSGIYYLHVQTKSASRTRVLSYLGTD